MGDSDEPISTMSTAAIITYSVMATAAAASAGMAAYSSIQQGKMAGRMAVMNAGQQAKESIQGAQIQENQAAQAERQAQAADYAAMSERQAGAFDVARQREQGTAFLSQQRADIGGSGLESTGSPLLVMAESAKQLELDRLATTYASESRARALEDEARMARYGGELSRYQAGQIREGIPLGLEMGRYQARAAQYGATLQATSTLISGGARVAAGYYGLRGGK